jgi:Fe-S cluster biogenesis protein NfuA
MESKAEEVTRALRTLRPAMQADGGDVELVSIENGVVLIRLRGACLACPSAGLTMRLGIERTLKECLPWVVDVVRVSELDRWPDGSRRATDLCGDENHDRAKSKKQD